MFHASMPLTLTAVSKCEDRSIVCGKALMDKVDSLIRKAYFGEQGTSNIAAVDYMVYLVRS